MKKIALIGLAVAALALTGCSVTGGGKMPGNASSWATFGFSYDGQKDRLKGTYHDGYYQAALTALSYDSVSPGCVEAFGTYRAQPSRRGGGNVRVYACDNGEPNQGQDYFEIEFLTGPYSGYSNGRPVPYGNLQAKEDEEDFQP